MLKLIDDLPPGVVGVEADDRVTADDYDRVLDPAVAATLKASASGKLRVLYVVHGDNFPHYTAGAVWEDAKLGLGHLRDWERIAVVSDADWLHKALHAFGWMVPGEVRSFALSELDGARAWITS